MLAGLLIARKREQDAEDGEIRDHRRAAVAQEWRDNAGERRQIEHAAGDQQRAEGDEQREPQREEERVIVARAHRDTQTEPDERGVEEIDANKADPAPLFAQHRQDQIRVRGGHDLGIAEPESRAEGSAARHRPQRVDDLFAAAYVVVPRREPHVDALVNGAAGTAGDIRQGIRQASTPTR